jgi:glycosyltransferase involved in cell wall biosynthesis
MNYKTTPKVSVIIACYKQVNYLEKVFYSLLNQTFTDFEIVVAEDACCSEIVELVQTFSTRFNYPIKHISHEDKGFRKTIIVNQAVNNCSSDYLIFIDGDCLLHHRFVERHYKRKKQGVVLSGRRIMLDEELSNRVTIEQVKNRKIEKPSFWLKHTQFNKIKRGLYIPLIYRFLNCTKKNYWVFGSNFSISTLDFMAVNGYDESIIGRGLEDVNLSQRFILNNYKIKRLTYEAIQYHLFHNSDPVPHSKEEEAIIIHPDSFYATNGINKS